jgi:microcystin-dependent protein
MSEPFIAEIRIVAFTFAPRGWAFCDGQLLQISQNTALFSLVGTTYGGDGRVTFGLPNLKGRAPMHSGNGPGLTPRREGQTGGVPTVALSAAQMPNHTHSAQGSLGEMNQSQPAGHLWGSNELGDHFRDAPNVPMAADVLDSTGGGQAHNNWQPCLVLNFCIALVGVYPSRN